MLLGGSFDPAYTLTISAVSSQLQPVTNKRNAALLQKLMEESLGVPPSRGVVRFVVIPDENLATNSKTVAADIEALEKELGIEPSSKTKTATKRQSMRSFKMRQGSTASFLSSNRDSLLPPPEENSGRLTPPLSEEDSQKLMPTTPTPVAKQAPVPDYSVPMPPIPTQKSAMDLKAAKAQNLGKKKSFMGGLFHKG
jgi:hypothetical protein